MIDEEFIAKRTQHHPISGAARVAIDAALCALAHSEKEASVTIQKRTGRDGWVFVVTGGHLEATP
ncbi:hypothetical protein [Denitromonas ohlonensis]|uniref:Uncharacterized protein n=2 Tax=Denitromonas TaxID=139331 RepID=A0A557SQ50_9RHOO|nr:hypothetical protein [Denitromonas ohlonensis]TVO65933.1 hypothetical protein FHP90_10700 [Denitromonas ohlonensis]TVO79526.1 hypothetical protein FHP89_01885 [Denitromonas ohlonensis]